MNIIRRTLCSLLLLLVAAFAYSQEISKSQMVELVVKAASDEGLKIVSFDTTLTVAPKLEKLYKYKILFLIEQPIDHNNPSVGSFAQQFVLFHRDALRPMVQITEGYTGRGANPKYTNELCPMLEANMVEVEHRYFGNSVPQLAKFPSENGEITHENLNWDYMTSKQAAADHHNVNRVLRHIYTGKWVATGISKGGQTAMFYTAYYPSDMDVSVPYVGPVCRALEDGRHEPFLSETVANQADRDKILAFQRAVLMRRPAMEALLVKMSERDGLEYRVPISEVLDMTVLEFPFAFWQWGRNTADIPAADTLSDQAMFDYVQEVAGSDYFAKEKQTSPFYVQAAKELGYYGYDVEPLKDLLTIKSAAGYLNRIMMPTSQRFEFDPYLCNDINEFLGKCGNRMMFIYGERDPWSSVMPVAPVENEKLKAEGRGRSTMILYINTKEYGHRARIANLPDNRREEAVQTLKSWLELQ